MPQFDFTTFTSQIFWFALCFGILYIAAAKIILPRISEIINSRKNIVDSDLNLAVKLDQEIEKLNSKSLQLRQNCAINYQEKIQEAAKNSTQERIKNIEELKNKIEEMNKKSRQDLQNFLENSKAESVKLIQDLTQKIKTKILN
jgi:F-type H+-transporting ATPase subunit b